jgi:hypothetical protein
MPTLGSLAPTSTVHIKNTATQVLPATTFGNLSIDGGGTKSLSGPTTVAGTLTLTSGILALQDYNLRITSSGSIVGGSASSFLLTNGSGALERFVPANKTNVFYPIGNPSYTPAALSQTTAGTADFFRARVFKGAYGAYDLYDKPLGEPFSELAIDRTWIIDEEKEGGADITLNLYWSQAEVLPNYKVQESQISHCDNGVWDKTAPKTVSKQGTLFVDSMSGITSFSPFITNSAGARLLDTGTLPVELLSFAAARHQQEVVLTWATALERDNDFFTVEASTDGRQFREIARVKGAGTSLVTRHYNYSDRSNTSAITYYRLKQTDLDQAYTYSQILAVAGGPQTAATLQVFPNPGKGQFYVQAPGAAEASAFVSDLSGKIVLAPQVLRFSKGQALLDISGQPAGTYLLTVLAGNARQVIRLVIN